MPPKTNRRPPPPNCRRDRTSAPNARDWLCKYSFTVHGMLHRESFGFLTTFRRSHSQWTCQSSIKLPLFAKSQIVALSRRVSSLLVVQSLLAEGHVFGTSRSVLFTLFNCPQRSQGMTFTLHKVMQLAATTAPRPSAKLRPPVSNLRRIRTSNLTSGARMVRLPGECRTVVV